MPCLSHLPGLWSTQHSSWYLGKAVEWDADFDCVTHEGGDPFVQKQMVIVVKKRS